MATAAALAGAGGCSFDQSGLPGLGGDGTPEQPVDGGLTDAGPAFADAAPGVDAQPASPDAAPPPPDAPPPDCEPVVLEATKHYDPVSFWEPDIRLFGPDPLVFHLPATLSAVQGNGGNHCSFLSWRSGLERFECAYKGGANKAHVGNSPQQISLGLTYHLAECRKGVDIAFPVCGSSPKGQPLFLQAGDQAAATEVTLTPNGDSEKGPTVVRAVLEGSCDPGNGGGGFPFP